MSIETTNTGSTVDVTYGSMCGRMGYHFDFGEHVEYISLLDQRKAFLRVLELWTLASMCIFGTAR